MPTDDRDLLGKAVTANLFGRGSLSEPAEAHVPDRYVLKRCLGRGGSGSVWLAHDRVLDRPLAVKVLLDASPQDVERFRREARCAARLDDPAIVKVFEMDSLDGQHYIAMQLVDGSSSGRAGLDREGAVRAIREVARALDHAHQEGIVHRDVKPENILVDRAGRVFLSDFGVARDLRAHGTLTATSTIVGTPHFMSPEQARGEGRAVDARTDIYSLGATLFSLLTGKRPFERRSLVETLHAVIHDPPPLPRSLDPTIPEGLEAVVLACMKKAPSDRYPSMRALIADLDRVIAGAAPWVAAPGQARAPEGDPEPPGRASGAAHDLLQSALDVAREIAAWDAERYRVSVDVTRTFPRLEAVVATLDALLAERPDLGWARFHRGMALFRLGRVEEALEAMERAVDHAMDPAEAQFELGRVYLHLGLSEQEEAHGHLSFVGHEFHHRETRSRLEQAVLAFQAAERFRSGLAPWQIECARAVERLAARDWDGCIGVCDAILRRDPDVEEVWRLRGDAERLAGRDPLGSYTRALEVRRSAHEALRGMALWHLSRGAPAEARACVARALRIHPTDAALVVLLARTHVQDAQADDAALEAALEHLERARGLAPANYDVAVAEAELALARARSPEGEAWLARAERALAVAGELDGCQNRVELLRAWTLLEQARHARARGEDPTPLLRRVLEYGDGPAAHTPDNQPWVAVLDAAAAELTAHEGRA